MNDNRPPEAHVFREGPPDRIAIQAYLAVEDNREIARLAAMMAPKPEAFDPVALIDAATALQAETPAGLIRRREAMVETMNYATLLQLQQELGVPPGTRVDHKQLTDPRLGPVLRKAGSMASAPRRATSDHIAEAGSPPKVPRPQLPCSIEAALRHVTNSPEEVPWHVLESALIDYHKSHPTSTLLDPLRTREERLRTQIERTRRVPDGTDKNLKKGLQGASPKPASLKLKLLEADLSVVEAAIREREATAPGMVTPAGTPDRLSSILARLERRELIDGHMLDSLSTNFVPFWEKNRATYLKRGADAEKAKKKKAAGNRAVGPMGPASKERTVWIKRTQDFLKFLKANPPTSSDLSGSISTFADKHCKLSTSRAKSKVRDLLGTLSLHLGRDFDAGAIMDPLRACGIKALTDDAVRECFELMKSALGRGVEKKSKKRG